MAGDGFDDALKALLSELQTQLSTEHRRSVHRLEAKISALAAEHTRLSNTCSSFVRRLSNKTDMDFENEVKKPSSPSLRGRMTSVSSVEARKESSSSFRRPSNISRISYFEPQGIPGIVPCWASTASHPATDAERHSPRRSPAPDSDEDSLDLDEGNTFEVLDAWRLAKSRITGGNYSSRRSKTVKGVDESFSDEWDLPLKFVMHPHSLQRLVWDSLAVLLAFLDMLIIPLQFFIGAGSGLVLAEVWTTRLYLTLDIPMTFLTGYVSHTGQVELGFCKVARNYAQTRLPVAFLLLACDWAEVAIKANGYGLAALQFLLVVRALRVFLVSISPKTEHIRDYFLEHIHSEAAKISGFVLGILLLLVLVVHVTACIWHGIHSHGDDGALAGYGDDGALAGVGPPFWERYTASYHHILALFMGEHIMMPSGMTERCFIIFVLIFGLVISAVIVGSLTTAMTRLQVIANHRSLQFATLSRYLSSSGISRRLAMRVQRNAYQAVRQRTQQTPESSVELLTIISDPLRAEIHYEVYAPVITQHPFFYLYNRLDVAAVRHICHTVLSDISLSLGDVLFTEFELAVPPMMYLVAQGALGYNRDQWTSEKVNAGRWVSEGTLWTTWTHLGTLTASTTECRLIAVDAQRFVNIASTLSTSHMASYAASFVQRLNEKRSEGWLTDIGEDTLDSRMFALDCFKGDVDLEDAEVSGWLHKSDSIVRWRRNLTINVVAG